MERKEKKKSKKKGRMEGKSSCIYTIFFIWCFIFVLCFFFLFLPSSRALCLCVVIYGHCCL